MIRGKALGAFPLVRQLCEIMLRSGRCADEPAPRRRYYRSNSFFMLPHVSFSVAIGAPIVR